MSVFLRLRELLFQQGVYEFYFPFILTFAIFYALIRRTRVFGKDKVANNISTLISVIAAFYVMAFSPLQQQLVHFSQHFLQEHLYF